MLDVRVLAQPSSPCQAPREACCVGAPQWPFGEFPRERGFGLGAVQSAAHWGSVP